MTASSRRRNYKNTVVFSYFSEKNSQCSSVVLESVAVLLHRIEIDLDEESSREDLLCSSSVQSRRNIFSKSFHQEWLASPLSPLSVVIFKEVSFKYTACIHRSMIMLDERLEFSFPYESSWEKHMTYWMLNVIKIVMGITREELHQVKVQEGSFQNYLVKFRILFAGFPHCLTLIFLKLISEENNRSQIKYIVLKIFPVLDEAKKS